MRYADTEKRNGWFYIVGHWWGRDQYQPYLRWQRLGKKYETVIRAIKRRGLVWAVPYETEES